MCINKLQIVNALFIEYKFNLAKFFYIREWKAEHINNFTKFLNCESLKSL